MCVCETGVSDFSLRVALQTLLREYTEMIKTPKDPKTAVQPTKTRPRRKARKYLYAIGTVCVWVCPSLNPSLTLIHLFHTCPLSHPIRRLHSSAGGEME